MLLFILGMMGHDLLNYHILNGFVIKHEAIYITHFYLSGGSRKVEKGGPGNPVCEAGRKI